jgi:wyosine [tRNA(Phe)-imidazoG37] synthetase (radical SAM superfamily)
MRYVFGPVPSRRLGRSLGVDPIAFKTCNWNCVYCQLGRSTPLHRLRKEYVAPGPVVAEVREALAALGPGHVDWITFGGSGEPTLNEGLGEMIRAVKDATSLPVAVLTNGSLLAHPEVREELIPADAVLPTLDAGTEDVFQRVNRPQPDLTLERHVAGLRAFREVYRGKLWVEVMLVKGVNDDDDALRALADALARIRPDDVHVTRPIRPPAEGWVEGPDDEGLERAARLLGDRARVVGARHAALDLAVCGEADEAILAVVGRHPMTREALLETLRRWEPGRVDEALARLERAAKVRRLERLGKVFFVAIEARYGWPPAGGPGPSSSE